jgi:hypothetical protein
MASERSLIALFFALAGCSHDDTPLPRCESQQQLFKFATANGEPTIASATSNGCSVLGCNPPALADAGEPGCRSVDVIVLSGCSVTFQSTRGQTHTITIASVRSAQPSYRCRDVDMVYDITPMMFVPSETTVVFPTQPAGGGTADGAPDATGAD